MEKTLSKHAKTDEERLKLAAELDKQLDEFIENLPKRKQPTKDAMDAEWLEDFDTHPFFMKSPPAPGEKLHPLYEGLQQLKYDPNENTPLELAAAYKDDGNFHFKHKNYRLAIIAYSEGLKQCQKLANNDDIPAILYNNRSAAHFFLKNYRSSLRDAKWTLKMQPAHLKALHRAAKCCFQVKNFDEGIDYCDLLLEVDSSSLHVLELRKSCLQGKKYAEQQSRKRDFVDRKRKDEETKLLELIKHHGVTLVACDDEIQGLEPQIPALRMHRVHLTAENEIVWPVVFIYPEYKVMEFIMEFNEDATFEVHLSEMLQQFPDWDLMNEYEVHRVGVYFEFAGKRRVQRVDRSETLRNVLRDKRYVVEAGTPSFMILVEGSRAEDAFLSTYHCK